MSAYLENLKADLVEAQKRLQESQQEAVRTQQVFQVAHADVQALQRIVDNQTRKEQGPPQVVTVIVGKGATANVSSQPVEVSSEPEVKKTELIRETLRQHAGMTPGELFGIVKTHIARPYLYSVLKRLRDNDEVIVRRKKYYLKATPKPEEGRDHTIVQ